MMNENVGVRGVVEYVLTDKFGNLKEKRVIPNQIQNLGLAAIASLIATDNPQSSLTFDYMAIGIGNSQAVTDNALASEITTGDGGRRGGADVVATSDITTVANDTIKFVTTWTFSLCFAVTEAGIFDDTLGSGTSKMLAYQDFSAINVASGDNLQITWKIAIARP
jgi:hypothetical protein